MTYTSDARPVTYMGSGPAYDDETDDQAMGENAAHALAGHLLPAQEPTGTFSHPGEPVEDAHPMAQAAPGGSIEDEPVDAAERASQRTAQNATRAMHAQMFESGQNTGPAVFPLSHAEVGANVRAAMRGVGA